MILADRAADMEGLRAAIRKADAELPAPGVIGDIFSVWDLLPGRPEVQREKLPILADIRKAIDDPALELAEEKERERLARLRPPDRLRVLLPADLPPLARRPFTEADGTIGRVLLVYPPAQGLTLYDGRVLLRIAAVLQRITLPDGRAVDRLRLGGDLRFDDPLGAAGRAAGQPGLAGGRAGCWSCCACGRCARRCWWWAGCWSG